MNNIEKEKLSEKDRRNMTILAGLAIIFVWFILVITPIITGTSIELLLVFSTLPTCLTILWFYIVSLQK